MEGLQTTAPEPFVAADRQFHLVASSLAKLLETARRELGHNQEAVKASLVTASRILQAEIERCSGVNGSTRGGLAPWQIFRVRTYIDSNLHRTIHNRDISTIACRSPAHFSRKFKLAVGQSPHAYVVRRRLERACHLMMTSAERLSEIALSAGFSGQLATRARNPWRGHFKSRNGREYPSRIGALAGAESLNCAHCDP
jgi:AraC family transcriptional regulator